jgi:DNA-binding MarR family transcriptional regulator
LSTPLEAFGELDRLVHEPARLAVLTALSASHSADFLFLQRVLGLTKGNLSAHISKLEAAGLVDITKEFVGKKPRTVLSLSATGREAIDRHWRLLDTLRNGGG